MLEKLPEIERRFEDLAAQMADPAVASDPSRYRELATAYADLQPVVQKYREWREADRRRALSRKMVEDEADAELKAMAREEEAELDARIVTLEGEIKRLLLPADPNDEKNVVLEIRAGTGGDEASLFANEILRMYTRYAENRGWKLETLSISPSGVGGVKEAIVLISGARVFSRLKFESGVHRVQRVPATEASGRIHTSAVTVVVMPEAEDVEIEIEEKDLRIDSFCSSGPGGQSVNTTYSAVRVTHLPSGLVVSCQDEKSWHKNKAKALKVLRSRLLDIKQREQQEAQASMRKGMVGSGDRSEKIRTYNFPQSRLTDHRIGFTSHQLPNVMGGALDEVLDSLETHYEAERMQEEARAAS